MPWTVETLNAAVDAELDLLPMPLRAKLARIIELIEAVGLEQVHEPHVAHLEDKLWEIGAKAKGGDRPRDLRHGQGAACRDPACVREEDAKDTSAGSGVGP